MRAFKFNLYIFESHLNNICFLNLNSLLEEDEENKLREILIKLINSVLILLHASILCLFFKNVLVIIIFQLLTGIISILYADDITN
jgi:hypothetical protein